MTSDRFEQLDLIDAPIFVLEKDRNGEPVYVFINKNGFELSGYSASEFYGKTALQACPLDKGNASYALHVECFETGYPVSYEVELCSRNLRRAFRMKLKPDFDRHGNVARVFAVGIEITAERDAQNKNISAAHSQMEQFVTLAAHDLRTPMRNIRDLTEMLREDFEDHGDGKLELIDLLEEVASKSTDLISEVLQHSLTANTQESSSIFALEDLCAEINAILNPRGTHSVTWPETCIETDRMVVQVVVRNLIDNALKYGSRDKLNIAVSVCAKDAQNIEITVEDDGKGMKNPGIAFLESGQMRADSGYGLLSIRRLLTARGGVINAMAGHKGVGTRVVFSLPGKVLKTTVPTAHVSDVTHAHRM